MRGSSRKVHYQAFSITANRQTAAKGVEFDFFFGVAQLVKQYESAGKCGVAAQINFGNRCEPAQMKAGFLLYKERSLRQVVLLCNSLQNRVMQPFLEGRDGGGISSELPGCEGVHLIKGNLHSGIMSLGRLSLPVIHWSITPHSMYFRLLVLFIFALASFGQQPLTLEEAVQRALQSHPDLSAAANRVESQEGLRIQAGKTHNPIFNFQWENLRAWQSPGFRATEDSDIFGFLQQQWETFGKRRRRVERASVRVKLAELEGDLAKRQVALRVKSAYWRALAAQERVSLLEESIATFQKIVDYHQARVREGAMAESDLIRVRLEGERMRLERNRASLDAARTRVSLQLAMGDDRFEPVTLSEALPDALRDPPFPLDPELALTQRVEVRIRSAAIEESAATTNVEKANAKPDFTWVAGYKRSGPFDSLVIGAQVPVPLLNRNEGAIASAMAEERYASSLLRASQQAVRAEAEAAVESYRVYRRQLEQTLPLLREQATQTAAIAEAAYREGGSDLLRLLDAQRVRIEAQQLYVEARVNYELSIVDLEQALGIPPTGGQP